MVLVVALQHKGQYPREELHREMVDQRGSCFDKFADFMSLSLYSHARMSSSIMRPCCNHETSTVRVGRRVTKWYCKVRTDSVSCTSGTSSNILDNLTRRCNLLSRTCAKVTVAKECDVTERV